MKNDYLSKHKSVKLSKISIRSKSKDSSGFTDKNRGMSHSIFIHGRLSYNRSFARKTALIHKLNHDKSLITSSFATVVCMINTIYFTDSHKIYKSSDILKIRNIRNCESKIDLKMQYNSLNLYFISKNNGSLSDYKL